MCAYFATLAAITSPRAIKYKILKKLIIYQNFIIFTGQRFVDSYTFFLCLAY
jgi:hypothetical protein